VTRTRSLHLATQGNGSYSGIAFAGGSPLPASGVGQAFSSMFGDPKQSAAVLVRAAARRKSVLDGSLGDYQRLATRVSGGVGGGLRAPPLAVAPPRDTPLP